MRALVLSFQTGFDLIVSPTTAAIAQIDMPHGFDARCSLPQRPGSYRFDKQSAFLPAQPSA
jgi:hypothetical protein